MGWMSIQSGMAEIDRLSFLPTEPNATVRTLRLLSDSRRNPGTVRGGTMTDLKPISSGSKSGARNRGTTSDPNPAKLQPTPYVQSTAPAKPAQTNGAQTT